MRDSNYNEISELSVYEKEFIVYFPEIYGEYAEMCFIMFVFLTVSFIKNNCRVQFFMYSAVILL